MTVATFKLSLHDRGKLSDAYNRIAIMPGIWRDVAAKTDADAVSVNNGSDPHGKYMQGMAAGQKISARQLDELLAALQAVLPKCSHDKLITEVCIDCPVTR